MLSYRLIRKAKSLIMAPVLTIAEATICHRFYYPAQLTHEKLYLQGQVGSQVNNGNVPLAADERGFVANGS